MRNTYTDVQLIEAVKTSDSIADVLRKLNIVVAGGNYSTIKNKIKILSLDTSHWTGSAWAKGKTFDREKEPLESILIKGRKTNSNRLKHRLIAEKIKEHICERCLRKTWYDAPIPLELHHNDGDNTNNELSNLVLICPNCHAFTNDYRGKNIKRKDHICVN